MNKISIFGEEMKEAISLSLSTVGEKRNSSSNRKKPLSGNESTSTSILNFPASRTMSNRFLLAKSLDLLYYNDTLNHSKNELVPGVGF